MAQQEIGKVVHYFDKAMAAVVKLSGKLAIGDTIKVVKGENEFEMEVASMEVDREPVKSGKSGEEVAIKVDSPAKEGSLIYRV